MPRKHAACPYDHFWLSEQFLETGPVTRQLEYGHLPIENSLFQILLASESPVAAAYDATVWIGVPGASVVVDCLAYG